MPDIDITSLLTSEDDLEDLYAIRNYIVNELDDNRCAKCNSSRLRTGDQASLILRLQKVLEEIKELKRDRAIADRAANMPKGVTNLASIHKRRARVGSPEAESSREAGLGTKSGPRRQGGRQPRTGSD